MKSLFMGCLRIVFVFVIFTIASLISESLLGKTLLLWQCSKSIWVPFHHKLAPLLTLIFEKFIFNFNLRCFPHKFSIYSCLHLSQKRLLMRFILSAVLQRTVRFLTTVHVVLGEYINCLPYNK